MLARFWLPFRNWSPWKCWGMRVVGHWKWLPREVVTALNFLELRRIWTILSTTWSDFGGLWRQELNSIILMGPFQLRVFYGSMICDSSSIHQGFNSWWNNSLPPLLVGHCDKGSTLFQKIQELSCCLAGSNFLHGGTPYTEEIEPLSILPVQNGKQSFWFMLISLPLPTFAEEDLYFIDSAVGVSIGNEWQNCNNHSSKQNSPTLSSIKEKLAIWNSVLVIKNYCVPIPLCSD